MATTSSAVSRHESNAARLPRHTQLPHNYFQSHLHHSVPSSSQPPQPPQQSSPSEPVSDHEFDVRLGRAVSLLRATLDDFMRIGLVDYDSNNVASSPSNSGIGIPGLDRLGLGAILLALGARSSAKEKQRQEVPPHLRHDDGDNPVYHPAIVFKFRPPLPTSTSLSEPNDERPNDNPVITFSGRTMYFGSAHILRHALSALFSHTNVVIERAHLLRGDDANEPTASGPLTSGEKSADSRKRRNVALVLRITFTGVVRVTQQEHEYTVIFRYRFDPDTGMIIEHKVDRIEPAPGKKIWAGLSAAFARLAGFHPQAPQPQGTGCHNSHSITQATENASETGPKQESSFVPLPLLLQQTRPSRCDNRRGSIATSVGIDWQRRRRYTTQTKPAALQPSGSSGTSRAATAALEAVHASSSASAEDTSTQAAQGATRGFFSRPTGADDMPGPSWTSILVGADLPFVKSTRAAERKLAELQQWAPASDDPSLVSGGSGTQSAGAAAFTSSATHFRPSPGITAKNWTRVVAGLSKSNLTVLVTLTAMAGYALCPTTLAVSTSLMSPVATLLALTAGTALCSAAANTINQLREVPYDAQMTRTRNRVLPSRTVSPLQAASFAGVASTAGVGLLATLNPLTAALGLGNIVLYAFMYTPMKRTSIFNTWLGAVVGALPPLMGWAACTGTLHLATDAPAWCLAALLFAWQFPHFNSLSHNLSSEYARGGYRMMSVLDPALNRRTSLRYSLALLPICSVALPLSGAVLPLPYALASLPANLVLIHAAGKFWQKGDAGSARWCFWVSLVHLPAVMILAMALKKGLWEGVAQSLGVGGGDEEEEEKEEQVQVRDQV